MVHYATWGLAVSSLDITGLCPPRRPGGRGGLYPLRALPGRPGALAGSQGKAAPPAAASLTVSRGRLTARLRQAVAVTPGSACAHPLLALPAAPNAVYPKELRADERRRRWKEGRRRLPADLPGFAAARRSSGTAFRSVGTRDWGTARCTSTRPPPIRRGGEKFDGRPAILASATPKSGLPNEVNTLFDTLP